MAQKAAWTCPSCATENLPNPDIAAGVCSFSLCPSREKSVEVLFLFEHTKEAGPISLACSFKGCPHPVPLLLAPPESLHFYLCCTCRKWFVCRLTLHRPAPARLSPPPPAYPFNRAGTAGATATWGCAGSARGGRAASWCPRAARVATTLAPRAARASSRAKSPTAPPCPVRTARRCKGARPVGRWRCAMITARARWARATFARWEAARSA
jgi:hypothetical protein